MLEQAIAKIKGEMEQNSSNPYIQVVGNFLAGHITENPGDAERILAEDKTISKSLSAMRSEAEKKKVGNCAVLTDAEGFAVVLKYFGIETAPVIPQTVQPVPQVQKKTSSDFDINLDELLKG